jgi:cytochrome bd ubiquinol oxidase subunit I
MTDLISARSQMGMSLGFHIIFSCVGIAMPLMMVIAEILHLRTRDEVYLTLARRWAVGSAIMFAVGAVSGTVLSFELGLLWPHFMHWAGAIIGMPFSLEGFAFFTEATFLGIYLYGWDRVSPRAHIISGIVVAVSGVASGVTVVMANSWMNTPVGFKLVNGQPTDINPLAALTSPAAFHEVLHMTIAAYEATGFAIAGIHSLMLLRDRYNPFHRKGLAIALTLGGICAIAQPFTGDIAARASARLQPVKAAAYEGLFKTQAGAPLAIGGIPDAKKRELRYAIEIPYLLSLMDSHQLHATVPGLDSFPEKDWPQPLMAVHFAFDVMVGLGLAMAALALWAGFQLWRKHTIYDTDLFLYAVGAATPLGIIAVECGWVVTEVGRQPWIIYNVMRTADAVTPAHGLLAWFSVFTLIYIFLAITVAYMIWQQVMKSPSEEELKTSAAAAS